MLNHRKKGYGSLILSLFLQNKIGIFIAEINKGDGEISRLLDQLANNE